MDFLKLLKSFEEFVYEALTWLILLPKTLARIVVRPRRMIAYAASELGRNDTGRFNDAISPPLLLILCMLIAHFADLEIRAQTPDNADSLANTLLASEQNLLLYRTLAFGIWALAGAAYGLLRTATPMTRDSLRTPFYEQCYLVSPFALLLSLSATLMKTDANGEKIGACLAIAGSLWFWLVQIGWIKHRARLPLWRAVVAATIIVLIGAAANGIVGVALSSTHGGADVRASPHPTPR